MDDIKYYAASVEPSTQPHAVSMSVIIKDEITKEEFDKIHSVSNFLKDIMPTKEAHRIVLRNGRELMFFLSEQNLKNELLIKKCDKRNFITDANRLIFNFCASMRTFVDHAITATSRKGKDKDFRKFVSKIFDESVEYRFFDKLRNYIIHYSYPFVGIQMKVPDSVKIICSKEHLLEFSGWGAIVKKDLESMPEEINLRDHIEPLLVRLETIYLMVYCYYAQDYCSASSAIYNFRKTYHLKEPTTMSIRGNIEGEKTIHPFPLTAISEGIKEMQHNPFIHLNIK